MRDHLHVCISRIVSRAAIIGAVLLMSTPAFSQGQGAQGQRAQGQGKVLRPEAANGITNPDVAESAKPMVPPPAAVAAAPAKPEPKGKAVVDPNAPEPLSERAQAALDRAKSALAAEDAEDFVPEPTPQAKPIAVGQPVKTPDKTAAAPTKPPVKCLAGCY